MSASKAGGIKETLFFFYFLFNDTCTREQTDHYDAVCFRNRSQLFIHFTRNFSSTKESWTTRKWNI